jgi:8-oxo-dGTP pyrophosphatase MutT (NUDIX family)
VYRPDLVHVWVFRVVDAGAERPGGLEILLIRRAPGRMLPGLWQPVTGSLEAGESIAAGALRELSEETALGPGQIEAFFDLDQVFHFHEPSVDGVLTEAAFAARVRADSEPTLSHEHDAARWVRPVDARGLVVWPSYLESLDRIERDLMDPDRAAWLELTLDGRRVLG